MKISIPDIQPGDLILRWAGFAVDSHVSLYHSPGFVIEASIHVEPRYKRGRVRKAPVTPDQQRLSFLNGYQFAGVV